MVVRARAWIVVLSSICNATGLSVAHIIVHGRLRNHPQLHQLVAEYGAPVFVTEYPGHGRVCARDLPEQCTHDTILIVVGGDGTLHDVVNGLMERAPEQRPLIHLVPLGTGNDVARALRSVESDTVTWDVLRVDYLDLDGQPAFRYCINVADIGLGGEVTRHYDGVLRRYPFGTGYMVAGLKGLKTAQRSAATINIDDRVVESTILSVCFCNSSWFGSGIGINPMADPTDGLIDVTVVANISAGTYLSYLPRLRAGTPITHPKVQYFRGSRVSVTTTELLPVEIDGEHVGTGPITVTVVPQAITFVKEQFHQRLKRA